MPVRGLSQDRGCGFCRFGMRLSEVYRHCRALRLRFVSYREECPTAVGIIEGAHRGIGIRCAPEHQIGEIIGFRRAFRLYGGTVSAQGISRSVRRPRSGVCPAGSASENRAFRDNGDCFLLKHRLHEERHSVISNIGIVHCVAV